MPEAQTRQRGWVEERGKKVKKWYGHFLSYHIGADGKRKHAVVVLGKKSELRKWEAEKQLEEIILKEASEVSSLPQKPRHSSFAWFVNEKYIPLHASSWRDTTAATIHATLKNQILPAFGPLDLDRIDRVMVQKHLDRLAMASYSWETINKTKTILRAIFEDAVDLDFILKNPARKAQIPSSVVKSEKKFLTEDSVAQALDVILTLPEIQDQVICALCIVCALIPSEIFALRWKDYTGSSLMVRESITPSGVFSPTKTPSRMATVALSVELQRLLDLWRIQHPNPDSEALIFISKRKTPLNRNNYLRRKLKPVFKKAGLSVNFQMLRRTCATLIQGDGSVKDVQGHLRHSKPDITAEVYMQTIPESVRNMVSRFSSRVFESAKHIKSEGSDSP